MNSLVNLFIYKCLFPIGLLSAALLFALQLDNSPILIESIESKTATGGKVYNKIVFKNKNNKDIWLMEQSHKGIHAKPKDWDKIGIVVEGKNAVFSQYQTGAHKISTQLKKVPFKVSCFFCHSNGPRAIRPNLDSEKAPVSFWNQARIALWNLKIKTYGKLNSTGGVGERPLRHPHPLANKKLNIKTCNLCHNEEGWFARGPLYNQNTMAIRFMVEKGHMPPAGFSLNKKEREELKQFLSL